MSQAHIRMMSVTAGCSVTWRPSLKWPQTKIASRRAIHDVRTYYILGDKDLNINLFWTFPAFTSAMHKEGGRHYKGHRISINTLHRALMLMALHYFIDSDVKHFTTDLCK